MTTEHNLFNQYEKLSKKVFDELAHLTKTILSFPTIHHIKFSCDAEPERGETIITVFDLIFNRDEKLYTEYLLLDDDKEVMALLELDEDKVDILDGILTDYVTTLFHSGDMHDSSEDALVIELDFDEIRKHHSESIKCPNCGNLNHGYPIGNTEPVFEHHPDPHQTWYEIHRCGSCSTIYGLFNGT